MYAIANVQPKKSKIQTPKQKTENTRVKMKISRDEESYWPIISFNMMALLTIIKHLTKNETNTTLQAMNLQ